MKDLETSEMTVKLNSNLYVGPAKIFVLIFNPATLFISSDVTVCKELTINYLQWCDSMQRVNY